MKKILLVMMIILLALPVFAEFITNRTEVQIKAQNHLISLVDKVTREYGRVEGEIYFWNYILNADSTATASGNSIIDSLGTTGITTETVASTIIFTAGGVEIARMDSTGMELKKDLTASHIETLPNSQQIVLNVPTDATATGGETVSFAITLDDTTTVLKGSYVAVAGGGILAGSIKTYRTGGLVDPPHVIDSATYTLLGSDYFVSVKYTETDPCTRYAEFCSFQRC